jgi:RecA/RadA recombinase
MITQIYGEAGSGKTNFCLQVALSSILSRSEPKASVIYISIHKVLNKSRLDSIFSFKNLPEYCFEKLDQNFVNLHFDFINSVDEFTLYLEQIYEKIKNRKQIQND